MLERLQDINKAMEARVLILPDHPVGNVHKRLSILLKFMDILFYGYSFVWLDIHKTKILNIDELIFYMMSLF